jgi:hypothetical protein
VEEMDLDALRLLIRAKIADGRLPPDNMPRVWGGQGTGETCGACDKKVEKSGLVIEGWTEQGRVVFFHPRCFYMWQKERGVVCSCLHLGLMGWRFRRLDSGESGCFALLNRHPRPP